MSGLFLYWMIITLMMTGLYVVMAKRNLVKKIIGLNIFQVSVILFYVALGKVRGGTAPILIEGADVAYSNPLPHVLMLTAIVVGIATTALALALVVRVHEAYGSIEEDEILAADRALEMGSAALGALEERRGRQEDDRALAEAAHKDRLAQTDESEETPT